MAFGGTAKVCLPIAIGSAAIWGSQSVGTLKSEAYFFAGIVLLATLLAIRRGAVAYPLFARNLLLGWVLLTASYAVIGLSSGWSSRYILGDAAVAVLPVLVMLGLLTHPEWLASRRPLQWIIALLTLAAVGAFISGTDPSRHDPPSALLIAGSWLLAFTSRSRSARGAAFLLVIVTGALTYSSGFRTHMILWALTPLVVSWACRQFLKTLTLSALVSALLLLLGGFQIVDQRISETRFESLLVTGHDESLNSRGFEWQDVRATMSREWTLGNYLVGYGFGATYEPRVSYIEANVADGRVHNVHFGPGLVLFRFGALGLSALAAALLLVASMLLRARRDDLEHVDGTTTRAFGVAMLLFSLEFLVLNSSVQPAMGFCLGWVLAARAVEGPAKRASPHEGDAAWVGRPTASSMSSGRPEVRHGRGLAGGLKA